jgi:regulatory protein
VSARVTAIERQKRNPDRYSVYIDGSFAAGVSGELLASSGLRVGTELDAGALDRFLSLATTGAARARALRFAGRRRRTAAEVASKLRAEEYDEAAIAGAIEHLTGAGLLDDEQYARSFIHDAGLRSPVGRKLIAVRLRRKGVPGGVIESTLAENFDQGHEAELAYEAASKYRSRPSFARKAGDGKGGASEAGRTRRFLMGRGFSAAAIEAAMKRLRMEDA